MSTALERLSEVIPPEHAVMALAWFANDLNVLCNHRDAQTFMQRILDVHPCTVEAFLEATRDLRSVADGYDHELSGTGWPT